MSDETPQKILIVDDDAEFRRSLFKTLVKHGYEISTASSILQASELLSKESYALILLDIQMPQQSGLEFLRYVKERAPESQVIMITAEGSEQTYDAAIHAGAFAFLNKPVKMKKILTYAGLALNNQ